MANNLLYPAVGGSPGQTIEPKNPAQAPDKKISGVEKTTANVENFSQILGSELSKPIHEPLKFSAHASARVQSRNLNVGPEQMRRINEAVGKAASKGLDETLVLTNDAAFIVSVKNRTIVTAMDRSQLEGNIFTNIDGAVII